MIAKKCERERPFWCSRNKSMRVRPLASLSGPGTRHCRELWCGSQMSLDPTLLWLWCRLAAASLIPPLAWELPKAMSPKQQQQQQKVKD